VAQLRAPPHHVPNRGIGAHQQPAHQQFTNAWAQVTYFSRVAHGHRQHASRTNKAAFDGAYPALRFVSSMTDIRVLHTAGPVVRDGARERRAGPGRPADRHLFPTGWRTHIISDSGGDPRVGVTRALGGRGRNVTPLAPRVGLYCLLFAPVPFPPASRSEASPLASTRSRRRAGARSSRGLRGRGARDRGLSQGFGGRRCRRRRGSG
jgi:hypothetical protein